MARLEKYPFVDRRVAALLDELNIDPSMLKYLDSSMLETMSKEQLRMAFMEAVYASPDSVMLDDPGDAISYF